MPTILSAERGSWEGQVPFVCAGNTACPPHDGLRGRAEGGTYYSTGLLLSYKGSLHPSRLASPGHIFNMNRKRNNKTCNGSLQGHFTKALPDDKLLGQSRHLLISKWNEIRLHESRTPGWGRGLGGGREARNRAHYSLCLPAFIMYWVS